MMHPESDDACYEMTFDYAEAKSRKDMEGMTHRGWEVWKDNGDGTYAMRIQIR